MQKMNQREGQQRLKAVGLAIATLLLASAIMAQAQTPTKIPRIGFLRLTRQTEEPKLGRLEEFRQGLRQLAISKDRTSHWS